MTASAREPKVEARLAEIARERRALRDALDHFDDAADFAAVWASEDPDEINRRDQVERPYERIVNDLQVMIALCEVEDAGRGGAAATAPPGEDPGRWRRAALRG